MCVCVCVCVCVHIIVLHVRTVYMYYQILLVEKVNTTKRKKSIIPYNTSTCIYSVNDEMTMYMYAAHYCACTVYLTSGDL